MDGHLICLGAMPLPGMGEKKWGGSWLSQGVKEEGIRSVSPSGSMPQKPMPGASLLQKRAHKTPFGTVRIRVLEGVPCGNCSRKHSCGPIFERVSTSHWNGHLFRRLRSGLDLRLPRRSGKRKAGLRGEDRRPGEDQREKAYYTKRRTGAEKREEKTWKLALGRFICLLFGGKSRSNGLQEKRDWDWGEYNILGRGEGKNFSPKKEKEKGPYFQEGEGRRIGHIGSWGEPSC